MKFNKRVLANGLTVLHEKRDVPVTTVMLAAKYGTAYESEEEKGIAHFIEHLCFKGTEKRTFKEIVEGVEKIGGILNAFTSEEITAYHARLSSEHLKIAMDVIFDVFFNANFPEAEVKKEASVICEEIKMYYDNPQVHVVKKIKNNLYEAPFGGFIAGSEETVKSMTRGQLFEKHREVYVPKNSVLCVVGNNDFKEVVALAESLCVERDGVEVKLPEIKFKNLKNVEIRKDLHQANLALGFHFPYMNQKGRYVAEIFSTILGGGLSSKLFSEVREKRGLVYNVKSKLDLGKNYGYMVILAGTEADKVGEVVDLSLKEFAKMGEISEAELEEAKVQVVGNMHVESEDSSETAVNLILEEVSGNSENYYDYEKNIQAVTLEDIQDLAKISEYASFSLIPE
ncbi:insulinase family protein [Candidatus Pacearchaeota archaeon]|nr:insulinase family protein [Candidatus Pacearchaeota archaeon]